MMAARKYVMAPGAQQLDELCRMMEVYSRSAPSSNVGVTRAAVLTGR